MADKLPSEFWQWAWRQVKLERKETGDSNNYARIAFTASMTSEIWKVIRRYKTDGHTDSK